jgi:mevalonate kinase
MIGEIHSEDKKLVFVIHHEMHQQVKDLFAAFGKLLRELFQFLQSHKEDRLSKLAALEKMSLNDAMTSIESTIREIRLETEKLRQFEGYIYTVKNFQK